MRPVPAALVALLLTRAVMADGGRRLQRIGRGDAGGPARDDRREHLQRQREQGDWKKFLLPMHFFAHPQRRVPPHGLGVEPTG